MKNNAPYVASETLIIKNLVDAINGIEALKPTQVKKNENSKNK